MTEADLCDIVVAKLKADGWKVACEVLDIDIVAQRIGVVRVLEAKLSFTNDLKRQLQKGLSKADQVIAVVGTIPKFQTLTWCQQWQIGCWVVRDGEIHEVVEPVYNEFRHYDRERLIEYADAAHAAFPDRRGGMRGGTFAPAQDVQRRIAEFRASHPKASWREVFAAVPSHYTSHKIMASAMASLADSQRRKAANAEVDTLTAEA
jgi:hypothetical protein